MTVLAWVSLPTAAATQEARDAGSDGDAGQARDAEADGGRVLDAAVEVAAPSRVVLPPRAAAAVEVRVVGKTNELDRLRRSAEAVTVVDTRKARQQSSDLGEVLARTQGVGVRREGGLGSNTRFSLNGLYDDQVRFFLDGVPLDVAGFPLGVANVPVNLIERVELYRGVVPIRFGADALGGVVNLVTDQTLRPRLGASYQVGSFGTHRATVDGVQRHRATGLVGGGSGYFDLARNDYLVDVENADAVGHLVPVRVPRFHDAYRAYGGMLQVGLVERPHLRRLFLQGFASSYHKDLQNNPIMSVAYGEARYGESIYGATARYEGVVAPRLEIEAFATYSHRDLFFIDTSPWIYDWLGRQTGPRPGNGEVLPYPSDQVAWQDVGVGRALVKWSFARDHTLRLSTTPSYTTRIGDERLRQAAVARDPLAVRSNLLTLVSGLEDELELFGGRLSNIAFVKDYLYRADGVDVTATATLPPIERNTHTLGVGDSLRFRFSPWLMAKASYEYATRLPTVNEVFGDLARIAPNLELEPERSHNANLGPRIELRHAWAGQLTIEANVFFRDSQRFIVLLPQDRRSVYDNVFGARNLGVEGASSWISPGGRLSLDATGTWQDQRVSSEAGDYGRFRGERVPNRPFLFASWGARGLFRSLPRADDRLEVFYNGRYVHAFFRSWEALGQRDLKAVIPAQVTHNVGVTWVVQRDPGRLTATIEAVNLTDARVFDNFGAQRPGRAFYLKLTGELR